MKSTVKNDDDGLVSGKGFDSKKQYVVVRTRSAGAHAGYLESYKSGETILSKARRLWYWDGAASLSQIAMSGTSKPQNCKFPCAVDRIVLPETIELIDATETARKSIEAVPTWKA